MNRRSGKRFFWLVCAALVASCGTDNGGSQAPPRQSFNEPASTGTEISADPVQGLDFPRAIARSSSAPVIETTASDSADGEQSVLSDSTVFTVRAVAGFETGLVKFASIDDRIASGQRRNVRIHFQAAGKVSSPEGLLYDCEGVADRKNCDVYGTVIIDTPGSYSYDVTYDSATEDREIRLQGGRILVEEPGDFVMVSVGDSVASGEGNPEKPLQHGLHTDGAYWDDIRSNYTVNGNELSHCHRSSKSGPAIAANMLTRTEDGGTNHITFIHIACSGASFGHIQPGDVLAPGETPDPNTRQPGYPYAELLKIDTQLYWIRQKFPQIDVLIVSGGANNVCAEYDGDTCVSSGFGQIVTKCITSFNCSNNADFADALKTSIGKLPDLYGDFAKLIAEGTGSESSRDDAVDDQYPTAKQVPSVVVITEYFDPTRDKDGDFPSNLQSNLCIPGSPLGAAAPLMSNAEWKFLYDQMVVPLNSQVSIAAQKHGWRYVGGIAEAFREHGYCSSPGSGDVIGDAWVIKAPESLDTQGDPQGTAHPDANGQAEYARHIYDAIKEANPPRTLATATTAGQPYEFGTWVNTDVEVTLMAYNPIKQSEVSGTFYAADAPECTHETQMTGACLAYNRPFVVTDSGIHEVSFFSRNGFGAPETRTHPVYVNIDKDPPEMTCSVSPEEIWPPDNKMVDVEVNVTAVDAVSGPADSYLIGAVDSYGTEAQSMSGFDIGTTDTTGQVLADRGGNDMPRVYTLTYRAEDHLGNAATCDVRVRVPHDRRH